MPKVKGPIRKKGNISETQTFMLQVIQQLIDMGDGLLPSLHDIMAVFTTHPDYLWAPTTNNNVRHHLNVLQEKGYILKEPHLARSIRLTDKGRKIATQ